MKEMVGKGGLKSGLNANECPHNYRSKGSIVVPQRHLALMSLSLGFLVIWTSVLAAVLISHSFKDNLSAKETVQSFKVHKQIARLVFTIGHEMVSTVDWLVSIGPKHNSALSIDDAIGITWKMTDSVISDIRDENNGQDINVLSELLTLVELKLSKFRTNNVFVSQNPLNVIKFYDNLCEIIERKSFNLDSVSNIQLMRRHTPTALMATTSYALFVKGMAKRFAELSFGTVFVRSEISVNTSDYFYYHFISRELIDNAFELNPRAQNRYLELQESDQTSDVFVSLLDNGLKRGDSHISNIYLNSIKNEIAILLRAKDFLNASVSPQVNQSAEISHKMLAFHLAIALIAILAVILCMALLCSAFRYTHSKQSVFSYKFDKSKSAFNVERNDIVYNLEFDDQIKILGTNSYQKQFF